MAPSRGSVPGSNKNTRAQGKFQNRAQGGRGGDVSIKPTPLWLQQRLVDAFVKAFPNLLAPPHVEQTLKPIVQEIKGHLYNRDFASAFGKPVYLDAYAARWSASRALGYVEILKDVVREMAINPSRESRVQVTCLGGGAGGELCALAGLQNMSSYLENIAIGVSLVDIADWSATVDALYKALTSSESNAVSLGSTENTANGLLHPFISEKQMAPEFHRMDLLNPSEENTSILCDLFQKPHLITLMFTLNELYSASLPKTQTLLLDISSKAGPGTLLLVVDSAGSYSTVTVNQKEKKYPMQWLLDHTLVNIAPEAVRPAEKESTQSLEGDHTGPPRPPPPAWERINSVDSHWFRLPEVHYPLELENMRYQMYLYRRL